jgi:uncharacterized membrane protein
LSDSGYLVVGCLGFVVAVAVQLAGWARLRPALRDQDPQLRRQALKRWVRFLVVYQLTALLVIAAYVVLASGYRSTAMTWPAPALGIVLGTAVALQVTLVGVLRLARTA